MSPPPPPISPRIVHSNFQPYFTAFKCIAHIIDELTEDVQPHDHVHLTLTSQTLHQEIWLPFMMLEQLTGDRVMVEVDRVVQSNDRWLFGDFYLNFIHALLPFSGGWSRGSAGVPRDLLISEKVLHPHPQQGQLALRMGHRDGQGPGRQPSQVEHHQAGKGCTEVSGDGTAL